MAEQANTRSQIRKRYVHLTWVVSGALFAAGLGLSLSLLFLGAGIVLMMASALTFLVGLGMVALIPRLMTFVPYACPFCQKESQVLSSASGYWCDSCGTYVRTAIDYGSVHAKD